MLKHLKGARIMQDCNTGELYVDPGVGGQCKAMGGRPFYTETTELTVDVPGQAELPNFLPFMAGDTVTVKVNDTEYTLSAIDYGGVPVIGDAPEAFFNGVGTLGWLIANLGSVSAYSYEDCTVSYMAEIVHQVPPKFLPNSVWTEEKTIIVFDNFDPSNYDNVAIPREHSVKLGDTVVLFVNGVRLTPEIRNNTEDGFFLVEASLDDDTWAWVQSNYDGSYFIRASGALSVIINRTTVLTNCDLAVEIEEHEDASLSRVVRGTFDATVAKIERGLPVSVYAHGTVDWIQNGYTQADFIAEITAVTAARRDNEYVLFFAAGDYKFFINRDGLVGIG